MSNVMKWHAVDDTHAIGPSFGVKAEDGTWVARVHPLNGTPEDIVEAGRRSHLLAASPDLLAALTRLLDLYDEESGTIDVRPVPACNECTQGSTPDRFNQGPCALHAARSIVARAEGE